MSEEERQKLKSEALRAKASDSDMVETIMPSGRIVPEQFELLGKLGEGGMGVVYKARNVFTDVIVAIKLVRANSNDTVLQRFQREAKATCSLSHPNVVKVLDFGIFKGTPFLVMEYLAGQTLADRLERRGALGVAESVSIFRNVCAGLARAHSAGLFIAI
jgi:serine/threonine protein kinase